MDQNKAIIIFIRKPELGKVKTRLAKAVGQEQALDIYKKLLYHTRIESLKVDCDRLLFYEGEIDHKDEWSADQFHKYQQVNGDLGAKMEHAFTEALKKYEHVLIIGSDCPEITHKDIERGFFELEEHDVVMGPARDGGYYLLGMSALQLFLFDNMPWSTEQLLEESIMRVQDRGLLYALLKTKSDIDYKEDWEEFKHLF